MAKGFVEPRKGKKRFGAPGKVVEFKFDGKPSGHISFASTPAMPNPFWEKGILERIAEGWEVDYGTNPGIAPDPEDIAKAPIESWCDDWAKEQK